MFICTGKYINDNTGSMQYCKYHTRSKHIFVQGSHTHTSNQCWNFYYFYNNFAFLSQLGLTRNMEEQMTLEDV